MAFSLVEFIRRQARAYLNDSQKAAIKKQVVIHIGGGIHDLAAEAARLTLQAERTIKDGGGKARREWVLTELKRRAGPILAKIPDSLEPFLWSLVDSALAEAIAYLNVTLDTDWVEQVEHLEDRVFIAFELALGLDLSGDGVIGTAAPAPGQKFPGVLPLILAAGLFLAAGPAEAQRYARHSPAPATDTAVEAAMPVPAETPAPAPAGGTRYPRHQRSPESQAQLEEDRRTLARPPDDMRPFLAGAGIETWIGHQPHRGGIDTGVGLVARRGDLSIGIQGAVNRAGLCVGWNRVGFQYLWDPRDGSWEPGAYLVPVRF